MSCVHFSQHTIYKYSKRRSGEHDGHSATVVYDKRACRRMPAGPRKRSRRGLLGKVDFAPLVGSQDAQGMDREILELRIYHVMLFHLEQGKPGHIVRQLLLSVVVLLQALCRIEIGVRLVQFILDGLLGS